jgi:peptide/nickel transport system permease protein
MRETTHYLLWRVVSMLVTILIGAAAIFFAMKLAPGDPALAALGESATPEAVEAFRRSHNLDAPLLLQFTGWLGTLFQGDFGQSLTIAGGRPISELIAQRLPNTIFIGLFAVAMAVLVSVIAGTIAALRRGHLADTVATTVAVIGISMPDFWLSYVLVFALALGLGIFPSFGFTSPLDSFSGALYSGFLPAAAVAAPMAAVFSRTLRAALLDQLHREHVFAARSFGFHPFAIFLHGVFRNALIPYVTIIGLQIRYILGGVVVIERIFGVPGIGSLMIDGAFARDYPVVQACAVVFLVIVLGVNLVVDLICTSLDPRRSR